MQAAAIVAGLQTPPPKKKKGETQKGGGGYAWASAKHQQFRPSSCLKNILSSASPYTSDCPISKKLNQGLGFKLGPGARFRV